MVHSMVLPSWYGTQYGITVVVWYTVWYYRGGMGGMGGMLVCSGGGLQEVWAACCSPQLCRDMPAVSTAPGHHILLQCCRVQSYTPQQLYCTITDHRSRPPDTAGASSGPMIQHTTSSRPRPISHPPATPPTGQRSLEMKTNLREV